MPELDPTDPAPPDQPDTSYKLLERIKRWYEEDDPVYGRWREQADLCTAFRAGHQWDEGDAAEMRRVGRPIVTFDQLGRIVDAVRGLQINNAQDTTIKGRGLDDGMIADGMSELVRWVRDEGDAEDQEGDAFEDLFVTGMAWVEQRGSDQDERGLMQFERIDPFEMRWHGSAKKRNLEDARRIMRVKSIGIDEAREMFPGFSDADLDAGWARAEGEPKQPIRQDPVDAYNDDDGTSLDTRDEVTIVEVQWTQLDTINHAVDPVTGKPALHPESGDPIELSDVEAQQHTAQGGKLRTFKQRRVWRAFVGNKILEAGPSHIQGAGFSYKAMTDRYDRKEQIWYGILRMAIDPQRYANKWLATSMEIMATGARGGIIAEENAFEDPQAAEEQWSNPRAIVWAQDGALAAGKITPRPQVQYPAGWMDLMQFAITAVYSATGINPELIGAQDREQAIGLEVQRKQAAVTVLAGLFKSLTRYRHQQARLTLAAVLTLMTPAQMARVLGPEASQRPVAVDGAPQPVPLVQALRGQKVAEYDVVVDDSPTSPNSKERAWALMQPLIAPIIGMVQAGDLPKETLAALIRYSPLPTAVTEDIVKAASAPPTPEQQQEQAKAKQLAELAAQAKIKRDAAAAEQSMGAADKSHADAAKARVETQLAPYEAAAETAQVIKPIAIHPTAGNGASRHG